MKKNIKHFSLGLISLAALAIPVAAGVTASRLSKEANAVKTEETLKNLIIGAHDNNFADVTSNALFDYGIRHGNLNAGGAPGCVPFNASSSDKYVYDSSDENSSYAIWEGSRLHKGSSDSFIIEIKAKASIKLSLSATAVGVGDEWVNGNNLYYYVTSNYNEAPATGNWIGNGALKKTIAIETATVQDYAYEVDLKAGEVFYWEYGTYQNGAGNFHIANRGLSFTVEKEVVSETLGLSTMINNYSKGDGSPIDGKLVSYALGHGDIRDGDVGVELFTNMSENELGLPTDTCYAQNWKIKTRCNDGFVVAIRALRYSTVTISRELPGTDWISSANITIYKNSEELQNLDITNENVTNFDFSTTLKIGDILLWQFSFEWGTAQDVESGRSIAMSNAAGADIIKTMPKFVAEEVDHSAHNWNEVEEVEPTCTEDGHFAYYECECGLYSEDDQGLSLIGDIDDLNEWLKNDGKIPAKGHTFTSVSYDWIGFECTASGVCEVCKETIEETKEGTYSKKSDATLELPETGEIVAVFDLPEFGSDSVDAYKYAMIIDGEIYETYFEGELFELPAPKEKEGYEFEGYYCVYDLGVYEPEEQFIVPDENVEFRAIWVYQINQLEPVLEANFSYKTENGSFSEIIDTTLRISLVMGKEEYESLLDLNYEFSISLTVGGNEVLVDKYTVRDLSDEVMIDAALVVPETNWNTEITVAIYATDGVNVQYSVGETITYMQAAQALYDARVAKGLTANQIAALEAILAK